MPEHDVASLLSLNIGITLSVLLAGVIGVWAIIRQINRGEEIAARTLSSAERIAEIAERIDARLRRQYTDIERDLQEIKELLGGQ